MLRRFCLHFRRLWFRRIKFRRMHVFLILLVPIRSEDFQWPVSKWKMQLINWCNFFINYLIWTYILTSSRKSLALWMKNIELKWERYAQAELNIKLFCKENTICYLKLEKNLFLNQNVFNEKWSQIEFERHLLEFIFA